MSELIGKVAIITGASKGLGLGIARAYVQEGIAVTLTGRTLATLEAAKTELEELVPDARVLVLAGDGKDHDVPADVVRQTVDTFGRLDILINNAQEFRTVIPFEDTTWDDMIVTYESGIFATVRYMQAALPHLKETKGTIINMASGAGSQSLPNHLAYGSNKEAIRSATRIAAREWGPFGITVNAISPLVLTAEMERWQEVHPEELEAVVNAVPLRRVGDSELHVGSLSVYLATEGGHYMTGSTFDVEGGAFLRP
jgi:NAD(P)-dependent dehydrogenase (short-subunit alcohol dehydrogenase family)